tara:strand:+ start:2433 stop:2912 length:480 start_codon:yes stop_codon:yes gene_type:complete
MSLNSTVEGYNKYYRTETVSHDIHNRFGSISPSKTIQNHSPFLLYTIKVLSGNLFERELPKNTQILFREIQRLRKKGMTYEEVTKTLNDNGWTTREGKKFYGTYVYNMEKRLGKRQKLIDRYERTIENLRVEFHYDENKEKEKDLDKEKIKERNVKWEK